MRRVRGLVAAITVAAAVVLAPTAAAGVPYTWLCGPPGNEYIFKTGSSKVVGVWVGNYGWRCHGGFWQPVGVTT